MLRSKMDLTPYQLWKGRKPNVSYFHPFGCVVYILKDREVLQKFDSKSDQGLFMGYATKSKVYRVYNNRTMKIMESSNVIFDERNTSRTDDDDVEEPTQSGDLNQERLSALPQSSSLIMGDRSSTEVSTTNEQPSHKKNESEGTEFSTNQEDPSSMDVHKYHSTNDIIGEITGTRTSRKRKIDFRQ